jgi:hypothetical protein
MNQHSHLLQGLMDCNKGTHKYESFLCQVKLVNRQALMMMSTGAAVTVVMVAAAAV